MATEQTEFNPLAPEAHDWGRASLGIGPGLVGGLVMAVILAILAVARRRTIRCLDHT